MVPLHLLHLLTVTEEWELTYTPLWGQILQITSIFSISVIVTNFELNRNTKPLTFA